MRVRWTDPAQTDFLEILGYIARDNPAAAQRVGRRLLSAIDALAAQPRVGRPGRVAGTRELVIPNFPTLRSTGLSKRRAQPAARWKVLRVLHGARRWPSNGG